MVLGILAHVDAGKTTLSEALLYETGKIRSLGRVDHQDAYLDTDSQERERGITIFSKQAQLDGDGVKITLLDTPGHVDFSAEMERTLQVLDYAILVISGTDGVQGHTRTLWRLLNHYQIPTFLFVNKMDLDGADSEKIQKQLKSQLSDGCVNFTQMKENEENFYEEIAVCNESLLDYYMEHDELTKAQIAEVIESRQLYPCFYGSALKLEGVMELLEGIKTYAKGAYEKAQESQLDKADFGALVYKIGRDNRGVRLTHIKVTSGSLRVKDKINYNGLEEKIDQIRIYSGDKYETVDMVQTGEVCAVTGLDQTYPGMGLGVNTTKTMPILEPVLNYQIIVPQGVNPVELMKSLKQLEEEDPQLNILWNEQLQEIHAQLMGQVQMEVLGRVILDRFGVKVTFGPGNIVYKETIAKPVEGVGHFEPLRHYAEAHLWMEPAEPGSGISVFSNCSEDVLDLNWQRLITTHILEREHVGVLTGSGLTDVKFTIVTGRAHLKHTEGGDFRQATYRAIRQGLKSTECVLLEPYYGFTLEVPVDAIGRAMTDIRNRFGKHESPEYISRDDGDVAVLTGTAPVATMQDYMTEVHSYTKGTGRLTLELKGYDVCHNSAEVVERIGYDSEEDTANPTGSVFCAHGAGFVVPWNEVPDYMHLEFVCDSEGHVTQKGGLSYDLEQQAEELRELAERKEADRLAKTASASSWELDQELQQIYAREFGMNKEDMLDYERKKWAKKSGEGTKKKESQPHQKLDKKGNPIYPKKPILEELIIVDGYNIIFAVQELKELSKVNIDSAKDKLKDMLANYQGYKGCRLMVVFDGYRKKGNTGSNERYFDLEVVHTKQDETADAYIERTVHQLVDKYKITVVTNDGLEQLTILSQGALRMSADMLVQDMKRVSNSEFKSSL
ncbi:MAG: TetM/TetW/TetO/TetS family tetracycline resistance ribosomal protection protein [Agathobacter sp.]|nr:TetM/TetW/TetO/TetS family tetracycline resistance ribosomal protection protein [Agathobacter sp.]